MAVLLVTRIQRFVGLSSDSKPTSEVPAGSIFYETDTSLTYLYDGSSWGLTIAGEL